MALEAKDTNYLVQDRVLVAMHLCNGVCQVLGTALLAYFLSLSLSLSFFLLSFCFHVP